MSATGHPPRSWIDVSAGSSFPVTNLPFGIFRPIAGGEARVGVAIGEDILDLAELAAEGLLTAALPEAPGVFARSSLNAYLALGRPAWRRVRAELQRLLSADVRDLRDDAALRARAVVAQDAVDLLLPVEVGDFTDFYASKEHATNVGSMFRPENPLLPNWVHLPVAYHGRSSSIVVSGTPVRRPFGQVMPDDAAGPSFAPARLLDFELELGAVVGPGNELGAPVPAAAALDHVFGFVLLNDWSARDVQKWEYQPLGPFLAKNFATTISPWVVTLDALEPFRCAQPGQVPEPLPYLRTTGALAYDIHLEVLLQTSAMSDPVVITRSNARHLYWNLSQMIAHHTCGGCNLRTGDILGTGTISGPTDDSLGSLLELAWRGTRPLVLPSGEKRAFLGDGDTVILRGWCEGDGFRIGFGECRGTILPPIAATQR